MFSLLTLLRICFSSAFTLIFIYISQFITEISNKKCPLSSSLYISNGKLLSSLLIIVGIINIVLPINKFVATIPVLGSSYVFLFMYYTINIINNIKKNYT